MMKSNLLTEAQVRHVAKLSRLKLDEEQVRRYTEQLGAVLGYFEKLKELDVEGVEPMAHGTELHNKFREDVVTEALTVEQALANAPRADGQFFVVPKVLGEGAGA